MSVGEFVSISEAKPEPKPETQVLLLSSYEIYESKAIMRITRACAEPRQSLISQVINFARHRVPNLLEAPNLRNSLKFGKAQLKSGRVHVKH